MELNWGQKAQAILALVGWQDFNIKVREDGTWYVQTPITRKEGKILGTGLVQAYSPILALMEYWEWLTDPKFYLVLDRDGRKAFKWNGFMWQSIKEEENYD